MATGVLVVLFGKATKLQSILLNEEKRYEGTIRLGVSTTTDDLQGEPLQLSPERVPSKQLQQETIRQIEMKFSGRQQQVPPAYSAVKVDGQRSYTRARKGEQVVHQEREVTIEFEELRFETEQDLYYRIRVSKGTYVRSLARDIGAWIGAGAALASIRRLQSGAFDVGEALPLEDLTAENVVEHVRSFEQLVSALPRVRLAAGESERLRLGDQRPLAMRATLERLSDAPHAVIVSEKQEVLGLANAPTNPDVDWRVGFLL